MTPPVWDSPFYAEALALLREAGVLDLHVDSIIQQRLFGYDLLQRHDARWWGQPCIWQADVPRMHEAGYRGVVMGIHYFPWESERGWSEIQRQLDYLDWFASTSPLCLRVRQPADWYRAIALKKIAVAPGVEGLHTINGRLERLEELARRGVAVVTLAHFGRNQAVCSSFSTVAPGKGGLTGFGREALAELQRLGLVVDLAHVHRDGILDVCKLAAGPVICSHTGLMKTNVHPRNLSGEEIDAIAATGGGIAIMYCPQFLTGQRTSPDSACIADSIQYLRERIGVERLLTGSDLDGWMPAIPSDMRDCRYHVVVAKMLLDRGWTRDEVAALFGGNMRRLFEEVRRRASFAA